MRRPPAWLAAVLVAAIAASGWSLGQVAGESPYSSSTATTRLTDTATSVRTIRRVTRGKVVTLPGGTQVVRVPVLIVHTDHHTIRVPAHLVPLKRVHGGGGLATSTVATPTIPVTVTVTVPSPPTTVTSVTTTTLVSITTITLPALTVGSTPEQEATP
jgi:hypothetical protein